MGWDTATVVDRRVEFCLLAGSGSGVSFTELCARFGVSRKTGYKWLAVFEREGVAGLGDRSRAPLSSPARTGSEMERLVCELRRRHPAWGGRKISRRLTDLGYSGVPAPSTITDILTRHGLMVGTEPHAGGFTSFEAARANDLWQMDFKGWFMTATTGRCDPFDVLDDHSRYSLTLRAGTNQRESTVKQALIDTFRRYGTPLRILCDNGPPWGNTQPGYRWTSLSVWLLDLGVVVTHSRPAHPQTLGKDERFHRTLDLEVLTTRTVWDSHHDVQTAFDTWRRIYNTERPHHALTGDVPATRYQPSPRPMPTHIPTPDYPDQADIRIVSSDGRVSYHHHRHKVGKPFKGRPVAITPTTTDGIYTIHYRHQQITTINLTQ